MKKQLAYWSLLIVLSGALVAGASYIQGSAGGGGGSGTVTTVSVTTANGVSGSVANATSTPAITLTLGAITPTTVAPSGITGATAATRLAGGTTSGAPVTGSFSTGDVVVDQSGAMWVCTSGGSPGTFTQIGGSKYLSAIATLNR